MPAWKVDNRPWTSFGPMTPSSMVPDHSPTRYLVNVIARGWLVGKAGRGTVASFSEGPASGVSKTAQRGRATLASPPSPPPPGMVPSMQCRSGSLGVLPVGVDWASSQRQATISSLIGPGGALMGIAFSTW